VNKTHQVAAVVDYNIRTDLDDFRNVRFVFLGGAVVPRENFEVFFSKRGGYVVLR
jgi:hypothetical protein